MVPAIAVAVAVGRDGIDSLLVASQVVLSIVLPFVIFPLVLICSSNVMVVDAPVESVEPTPAPSHVEAGTPDVEERRVELAAPEEELEVAGAERKEGVSFKSPLWVTCLGYFIFVLVVVANSVSDSPSCPGSSPRLL
jgi:metal iron transporter